MLAPVMIQFIADLLSSSPDWEELTTLFMKRFPRCRRYLETSPIGAHQCLKQKYHYATREEQSSLSPLSTVFVPPMVDSSLAQSASKEHRIAELESLLREMQAIIRSQNNTSVLLKAEMVRLIGFADDLDLQKKFNELELVDEVARVNEAWKVRLENEVQNEGARVEGIWKEKLANDVQAARKSMELDAQQLMYNMQEQHTSEMTKLPTLKLITEQSTSNLATSSRVQSAIKSEELYLHKMRLTVIALCTEVKKLRSENARQQD